MTAFVCLLLAASTSVELADELYRIPPHNWRYMELGLKQRTAAVNARFEVDEGPPRVRLDLMTRDDLERFRTGAPHGALTITPSGPAGRLFFELPRAGDYVLVVENRGSAEAEVHLRVLLDFSGGGPLAVTQITPLRRAVVVGISLACFAAIVTYSARKLLRAIGK